MSYFDLDLCFFFDSSVSNLFNELKRQNVYMWAYEEKTKTWQEQQRN